VPTYPPGLPLLMALEKTVAGACAVFWISPVAGRLLVLATYGVGRRVGTPVVGVVAAWLTATSPTVLFAIMQPMSDIPVAAAWAISVGGSGHHTSLGVCGRSVRGSRHTDSSESRADSGGPGGVVAGTGSSQSLGTASRPPFATGAVRGTADSGGSDDCRAQ
jgi:hypothetical protein